MKQPKTFKYHTIEPEGNTLLEKANNALTILTGLPVEFCHEEHETENWEKDIPPEYEQEYYGALDTIADLIAKHKELLNER